MPSYNYLCSSKSSLDKPEIPELGCGHTFTVTQRMSDDKLITCPECKTDNLQRVIGAPVVSLKGGGWTGKIGKS